MSVVYAVRHVTSKPLITVNVNFSANEAIKLMAEKDIGSIVVTEKGEPVGIITERDIIKKCCLEVSCMKIKVGEIMSKPLITVDADTPIGAAMKIMLEKNIRRLLVTEEGTIMGIVTQKDLMRGTINALHGILSVL